MAALKKFCGESGSELVEFALVLPLLLLIVTGIFDFGLLFQRYQVVTNAAREGARMFSLVGFTQADVQARVNSYLAAAGLSATATTTAVAEPIAIGARAFSGVRVTVAYPYTYTILGPIASLFGGTFGTVTLTAVAVMRSEGP